MTRSENDGYVIEWAGRRYACVALTVPCKVAAPKLTKAESRVVEAVVGGRSNGEIAKSFGVSIHTVANQLASVYRKLGLRSRHELMRWLASQSDGGAEGPGCR